MTDIQKEIIETLKMFNHPSQNVLELAGLVHQRRALKGKPELTQQVIINTIDNLASEPGLPKDLKAALNKIYNYGR